jgi:serine phosphatase RsbU (regulator of sigma subunit)/Tfp pilus assembly protein PilF
LLLSTGSLFSQNAKLDSLKNVLAKNPGDTTKSNIIIEIARTYLYDYNDGEKVKDYAEKGLVFSRKINYKKGIAYSYLFLGICQWKKGEFDRALAYYKASLLIMKEIKEVKGESSLYGNIGYVYNEKGDYPLALKYTLKALKMKEATNEERGIAVTYNNLGNIYNNQSNFKEAIICHLKALKIKEKLNDKAGMGGCYINIALVFSSQGKQDDALANYEKAIPLFESVGDKYGLGLAFTGIAAIYVDQKKYAAALDYYQKGLKTRKEIEDKVGIAACYTGIGNLYLLEKKTNDAIAYQLKALKIQEEIGDKKGILGTYLGLGNINEQIKNDHSAIDFYTKALNIAKEIDQKEGIRDCYANLSSVYGNLKEYEKSFSYLNLFYAEKDSLLNKENFKQIFEINTRYQTEKKQNEIELLTKDQVINEKTLKQQRIVRIALLVGLVLVCILLFSVYARYRFKQKANLLLEQQKKEIQEQNVLITDSIDYAKTIQEAILPSSKRVKEFFPQSFVLYKPKATVSGDFYWIGQKEDKVICIVADCTGHGVPGAFMSLLGFNMLDNIVEKEHQQPSLILNTLNSEMVAAMTQEQFITSSVKHGMDAAVIRVDKEAMQLQYAGAHNSLYRIRNGELTEIKADKQAIGSFKEGGQVTFTNHQLTIEKDDIFYMFSDGFPDQIGGPNRKKFYYPPFKELLVSIHHLDMEEQKLILDKTITEWRGERDQTDDILVMGIRI